MLIPENPEAENQASAGSEERVLAALARFRPRLRALLVRYKIPFADGEDVAQEIALVALRSAGASRNLEGWLLGVALNQCRMYWRKKLRREEPSLDSVPEPTLDSDEERSLQRIDFERGLRKLPPLHGKALHLVAAGYSNQETAERIGYSPSGFRKLIQRSLRRLAHYTHEGSLA